MLSIGIAWEVNSLRPQPVIVSSRKVPPHKGVKEALRDKNKELLHGNITYMPT